MTGNPKSPAPDPATLAAVRRQILAWWDKGHRDMPWRQSRDPYAIWVSEIMLQQTQVATVVPYYRRFLRAFPSVDALAAAPPEAVLKAWEGLGYYSRARNLHRAAQQIIERHGGKVPQGVAALRALAGVGRYTAGAIASIALGHDEPAVDGNIARVLSRLFALTRVSSGAAASATLWKHAAALLPAGKAGDFNQAMMDLGATICLPVGPRCGDCPIRPDCRAHARDLQERIPRTKKARPLPHYLVVAAVLWRRGRILIAHRLAEGLLGGLWELPGGKVNQGEGLTEALVREVREEVGLELAGPVEPLAVIRHAYSHFRITMHVYQCRGVRGRARALASQRVRWVRPTDLGAFAFPKATLKALEELSRAGNRA